MSNFDLPKDFYPTPENLIRKMIDKLGRDWKRRIKYILEPSAGRGDLIDGYKKIFEEGYDIDGYWCRGSKSSDLKVDLVELDDNLVNTLRGKNYNVVFNDFLNYHPIRYYDLILANFPFSDGVKHFLKAIEIQGRTGGEIIAIVNAETIRNTYSNDRIYLKQLLDKYNADIELIEDGFVDADRKTDVEIAMVYLKIPMIKTESMFEREFKRDNPEIEFKEFNALTVKMNKLQQLVFEYEMVVKSTTKLFEEKLRVDKLLNGFGIESKISICNDLCKAEKIDINDFVNSTNMRFWERFIEETSFETRLPSKLKDNFRMNMQKQQNIAFNMDNVQYFYKELMNSIPRSYEENCNRIFDELTTKSCYTEREWDKNIYLYSGWKTNSAYKIGKKNIIRFYNGGYMYNIPPVILDLVIVFENLSGIRDTLSYTNGEYQRVLESIKKCEKNIECEFFTLDVYKKGTIHIKYKDMRLVEQFNIIVSKYKKWLPDSFGKKAWSDMSEEELDSIKSFGIKNTNDYSINTGKTDYLRLMA